ncbi:MAG: OmpA family protein [Saprospirales bacterium]|nr:OmpA family protein [Saprospirales bacterium]MBK8491119.1 OmpA family protein [Saprospirales bacterium]
MRISFLLLFAFSMTNLFSQSGNNSAAYGGIQATPKYAWEVGLHGGHFFSSGDVAFRPSFGAGFHVRRALDYVFSLRLDGMYGLAKGDSQSSGHRISNADQTLSDAFTHKTTYASVTAQGVMVLNNLRWDKPQRKVNIYVFAGAGPTYIQTAIESKTKGLFSYKDIIDVPGGPLSGRQTSQFVAGLEAGAGVSVRITGGFNLSLEHKGATVFGKRTDLMDGVEIKFRDIINYTALRFNFNLRGGGKLAEPLYWVNPLDVVLNDISELKARPILDLTDSDKDGVIDIIDQDKNSPPGAPVDTRGVPLDSDDDGIADYLDREPYSPPGTSVDGEGVSQNPQYQNNNYVDHNEVDRLINEALAGGGGAGNAVVEWFLPMVHFNIDSYKVREADYGNLANIAKVLESNPRIRVVVQGFTDKTASDDYNSVLSYNRAQAAIDHLVNLHGIDRSRLLLQYGGESNTLVPSSGSSLMNRRVEFRVASSQDVEMPAPQGAAPPKVEGNIQGY